MEAIDITKYIDIALKRKYWIIIPFLVSVLGGLGYFLKAPKVYEAQTLILVQPKRSRATTYVLLFLRALKPDSER